MLEQPRVFVSHTHADIDVTSRLVSDLQQAGAQVWVDVSSLHDGNFMQRINEALANSDWVVLVQTPQALQSPAVRTEIDAAIILMWHQQLRGVIPFIAEPCVPTYVPPTWRVLHYYDATRGYEAALHGLLKAMGLSSSPTESALLETTVPTASASYPIRHLPLLFPSGALRSAYLSRFHFLASPAALLEA
jgi:hypothetical protein